MIDYQLYGHDSFGYIKWYRLLTTENGSKQLEVIYVDGFVFYDTDFIPALILYLDDRMEREAMAVLMKRPMIEQALYTKQEELLRILDRKKFATGLVIFSTAMSGLVLFPSYGPLIGLGGCLLTPYLLRLLNSEAEHGLNHIQDGFRDLDMITKYFDLKEWGYDGSMNDVVTLSPLELQQLYAEYSHSSGNEFPEKVKKR